MNKALLVITLVLLCASCATGPKPPSAEQRKQSYAQLKTQQSIEYLQVRDFRSSMEAINQAVEANPKDDIAWLTRAIIYQTLKLNDKTQESFQKALSLKPESAEVNNNYGWFLCSELKQYAASLAYFDKAINDPTYPTPNLAYMNKGICLGKMGNYINAEKELNKAYALAPGNPEPILEMARMRLNQGNATDANKFFREYQRSVNMLGPNALLLGWKISRAAGDMQAAYEYEAQLRSKYYYSEEFKEVISGM